MTTEKTPVVIDDRTPLQLIGTATDKGLSPKVISELMDLADREETKRARQAFMRAMAQFQANVPGIEKNGVVSNKYTFATLEDILTTITPHLRNAGLMVTWDSEESADGTFTSICKVSHESGHVETGKFTVPIPKLHGGANDAQNTGAANTYARRYAIVNALNLRIIGEDTDAYVPATVETVSAEQAANIECLLDEIGAAVDKNRFFRFAGNVTSVSQIPATKYHDIMRMLEQKRAKGTPS